jgi:hypothetical protein
MRRTGPRQSRVRGSARRRCDRLFLDDIAVVQVESLSVAGLLVKVVLKLSLFAKVAAATDAMDRSMLGGVVGDIHLDRPARLTIEFLVEPLGVHRDFNTPVSTRLASVTLTVQPLHGRQFRALRPLIPGTNSILLRSHCQPEWGCS